jgi:hypothetical protein
MDIGFTTHTHTHKTETQQNSKRRGEKKIKEGRKQRKKSLNE